LPAASDSFDPLSTCGWWVSSLYLVSVLFASETLLFAAVLLGFGEGWQLATAFSLQLLHGL